MVPCECISGPFAKAITTHPIVPISAIIAVIAAGRNLSDRSFLTSGILEPKFLNKSLKLLFEKLGVPLGAFAPDRCAEHHTVGRGEIER